jgi:hypothetical protein
MEVAPEASLLNIHNAYRHTGSELQTCPFATATGFGLPVPGVDNIGTKK